VHEPAEDGDSTRSHVKASVGTGAEGVRCGEESRVKKTSANVVAARTPAPDATSSGKIA